jgi:hypothetical protein
MITVFSVISGLIIDKTQNLFMITTVSSMIGTAAKLIYTTGRNFNNHDTWFIICMYICIPLSDAAITLSIIIAIKRNLPLYLRRIAYGIHYTIFCLGIITAGIIINICDTYGDSATTITAPTVSFIFIGCSAVVSYIYLVKYHLESPINDQILKTFNTIDDANADVDDADNTNNITDTTNTNTYSDQIQKIITAIKYKGFWKCMLVGVLMTGIQSIFKYIDITFPIYMRRRFGNDTPYSLMIITGALVSMIVSPFIQVAIRKYDSVRCLIFGCSISAFAPMFMLFDNNASGWIFNIIFSFGCAIWEPVLYDYIVHVAPEGSEGIYASFQKIPALILKIPTGILSGVLLNNYCKSMDDCSFVMWGYIFLMALITPIGLFASYSFIYHGIKIVGKGDDNGDDNDGDNDCSNDNNNDYIFDIERDYRTHANNRNMI